MAFVEDLSVFLADFGVTGTLNGEAVRGIFDAPSSASQFAEAGAAAADPQFQLPTASVPASPFGKALVLPQGSFTVREHIPDGTGMSLLLLTKA